MIALSAYSDLEDAIGYYESKVIGLGKRMEVDFWKSVDLVQKNPMACRIWHKLYRHKMLENFPYSIIYEVLSEKIIIYGVAHLRIQPEKRYKI